jgi:CRP-like cAMP-binding protein
MFLVLEGVLAVEIDDETVAHVGTGALLGELALLGDGTRKATLRAVRPCRIAVLPGTEITGSELAELALKRRESR